MFSLDSFTDLLPPCTRGVMRSVAGFAGAGESLAIAAAGRRPALFLARDALTAAHVAEEIAFFAPDTPVRLLPDWGCLPFDEYSPLADAQTERMAALAAMQYSRGITVASAVAALFPCPPPSYVAARALQLRVGETIHLSEFCSGLVACGYARVERVLAAGEFAVYGGQIDIFPPQEEQPFRLVLADNEIEQIRIFDPRTQMSVGKTQALKLSAAGECDLSSAAIAHFRTAFVRHFGAIDDPILAQVVKGRAAAGMEFMLPLFYDGGAARLLDYATADTLVVMHEECRQVMMDFMAQAERRRRHAEIYEHRAVLPTEEVFLSPARFFESLKKFAVLELCGATSLPSPPSVAINRRRADSHAPLKSFLRAAAGRILIAVDSVGRRDSLCAAFPDESLQSVDSFADCGSGISVVVAPLRGGFVADGLTLLTESDIFDVRLPPRRHRCRPPMSADELSVGDAVTHRDYGVGIYAGIETKTIGGEHGEFLCIRYADEQLLWLPAAHLHLLSSYYGAPPMLSKLGSGQWKRARARAEKNVRDTAARLLALHARRVAAGGIVHCPDEAVLARFAAGFQYVETPDQVTAAGAVINDMRAAKPMDRLLVADVGFGKTEIAMRAACAAALSGMQTAVLAPTTLLAEQHARSFADRFAGFPARVAALTRLSGSAEKKQTLADIAAGRIDIVIGTHALLQPTVCFYRLGLAIIDEEHRFGVRQKEHFKALRANVDVLSLSATPIPRTMAMALEGARDISIISTPPPQRLAVRTAVASFSRGLIVDACERELLRGGQIYFVHNDIRGLPAMADRLREWLPSMKIVIAHGGMSAVAIEKTMRSFVRGDADMLLATTIVESGLDIANANTMIINRADHMGMSRLHQLRGRVGRAGAQAYAFFLTPPDGASTTKGDVRLSAIADYGALGDGWLVAMRDLETRGAGEILGDRQSGDLAAVGYAMYQKMLTVAVHQLSGEGEPAAIETLVELSVPSLLPADYVHSVNERLRYYRRLSAVGAVGEIDAVRLEWEDRFGDLPAAATNLIIGHKLRLLAGAVQVTKLRLRGGQVTIEFADNPVCRPILLKKIGAGACRPGKDGNTIIIDNLSKEAADGARQMADFLRDLTAA